MSKVKPSVSVHSYELEGALCLAVEESRDGVPLSFAIGPIGEEAQKIEGKAVGEVLAIMAPLCRAWSKAQKGKEAK